MAGGSAGTLQYGHYRVLENERGAPWMLGHGAMGITYKAEDTNLHVPVALKVISPLIAESPGARDLFLSEARGAASLRHRNAAAVHHLGVDARGELFFAMEFIAGETADALITRQRRLEVPLALDIAQQTACALAAAHGRRLIHRDLKPANLMLSDEGDGTLVVKVIDFGLCKAILPRTGGGGGGEEQFFGTLHYASPEQIRCEPTLDGRSDFYALGATLWKMLTGQPVFGGSLASIRQRHLEETPPFDELPADVSLPVRDLLASLLSKDPSQRPQTPRELIDRIEAAGYDHRGAEADPRRHWKTQGCVPLIGSLLAHNYHLEALADESRAGARDPVFRAEDVAGGRQVAVQLLDRDRPLEALRAGVERQAARPHRNLVQSHTFSSCRGQPFIVSEWLDGFSLGDLLRAQPGGLRPVEALRLIRQAAEAFEHSRAHGLGRLDLRPDAVRLHFNEQAAAQPSHRELLTRPMDEWPDFSLKLQVKTDLSVDTTATVQEAVRGLGDLMASLLGGNESTMGLDEASPPGAGDASHTPSAVRRVLDQTAATTPVFASVADFIAALTAAFQTQERRLTAGSDA